MAAYEYLCPDCGRFEARLAIGTAPDRYRCPNCAAEARRVFSPPALRETARPLGALLEREEQSREAPEVVSQVPTHASTRPSPTPHPAVARPPQA